MPRSGFKALFWGSTLLSVIFCIFIFLTFSTINVVNVNHTHMQRSGKTPRLVGLASLEQDIAATENKDNSFNKRFRL